MAYRDQLYCLKREARKRDSPTVFVSVNDYFSRNYSRQILVQSLSALVIHDTDHFTPKAPGADDF